MLEANFPSGEREIALFGLTQWDKGRKLAVSFENMPTDFQVHFSVRGSGEATVVDVKTQNSVGVADIPDELLTQQNDIEAWIYLTDKDTGETAAKATLYVRPRARPKGYIEDLVPSYQKTVENMLTDLRDKLEHITDKGLDSEYVPDYVKNEALRVAKNVMSRQNENTLSFICVSDTHYDEWDYNSKKGIEHMGQAIEIIRSACNIDFGAFLGGYILDSSGKNISDAKNEIMSVNKALYGGFGEGVQLRCKGPDEMLGASYYLNSDYIDSTELYPLIAKWCKDAVFNEDDEMSGYCYKDLDRYKIRVICLDTSDFKKSEAVKPETFKAKMSSTQLQWFCSALDLSDKSDCDSWCTVIFSHYPLNYFSAFSGAKAILKAYSLATSVNIVGSDEVEISYSFAGKNAAPVIAQFHGGLHNFKINYLDNPSVPMISIPNAGYHNNNYFAGDEFTSDENLLYGEDITYNKTALTKDSTAFCVVTLDKEKGKIYLHSYGAGYDREVSFDTVAAAPNEPDLPNVPDDPDVPEVPDEPQVPDTDGDTDTEDGTYTNRVPTSQETTGDTYHLKGYSNDTALDSSGNEVYIDGFTHTGFISCENKDVIRVKGGTFSSLAGNYIIAYDADYSLLWSVALNGALNASSGVSYNGDVAVFDSGNVTTGVLTDMKFIRVSCEGDGKNLIVTVNEEIPTDDSDDSVIPPSVQYTNIIPYALEAKGEAFNGGLGYIDGYRLNSSGVYTAEEGYTVTGYIYSQSGAVIRLKGGTWSARQEGCLALYDSDFSLIAVISLTSEASIPEKGISFSSGVLTFNSSAVTAFSLPSEFYIRFSANTSGENLIATYNEELT